METARIRRAGYPIRHTYKEFVERYRILVPNIKGPIDQLNCRQVAKDICKKILPVKSDYQFGKTKVFLKDNDDIFLEEERSAVILKSIITIQRGFRRILFKRFLEKHRKAVVMIQKTWRGYREHKKYVIMRKGFHRLAASVASRQLTYRFSLLRTRISRLQAHCRGYLVRKEFKAKFALRLAKVRELKVIRSQEEEQYRKAKERNWKQHAEENYQKRLRGIDPLIKPTTPTTPVPIIQTNGHAKMEDFNNDNYIDVESSKKVVDDVFGFLDEADVSGPVGPNVREKSLMFEQELRKNKFIPSKLLSRPVNYYESTAPPVPPPRKYVNQTRL